MIPSVSTARIYLRFAEQEAQGRSALYEQLSRSIAEDAHLLHLIGSLPPAKRQPNLLFASFRSLFGTPSDWSSFRHRLIQDWASLFRRVMERSTQTNEPARCATLLPILSRLPGPLALIEVGAAAGLCLIPDRYAYEFGSRRLTPEAGDEDVPLFKCRASGDTPLPVRLPDIAWRAGLDIEPIRAGDREREEWLEDLVWPGQPQRLVNLRKAMALARRNPPRVVRGDLRTDLEKLCVEAPSDCTRVVFHSAVLAYVQPQAAREAFAAAAMEVADYWLANEAPSVFPALAAGVPPPAESSFLLSLNGRPVAWTDPHGASIQWISEVPGRRR